jgi:hypothetical protein
LKAISGAFLRLWLPILLIFPAVLAPMGVRGYKRAVRGPRTPGGSHGDLGRVAALILSNKLRI